MTTPWEWEEERVNVIGRTIVGVRPLSRQELADQGWFVGARSVPVVLELDDGSLLWASQDDEGNGPGTLFAQDKAGRFSIVTPAEGG